jgi:hypothetical protein
VEFRREPWGKARESGHVAEYTRGLGDLLGTDECVTQSYLTTSVAAYIDAVESYPGVGRGVDGILWSAQQREKNTASTVQRPLVYPVRK